MRWAQPETARGRGVQASDRSIGIGAAGCGWAGMVATVLALLATAAGAGAPEAPPASLTLLLEADGAITASGRLPEGLGEGEIAALLPGVRGLDGLGRGGGGDAARWRAALEALNIVLPRIAMAQIRLTTGAMALRGRLSPGVSLKEVRPALRAALGPGWRLEATLAEVPPAAAIAFAHDAGGTRLSGLLPAGISPNQALTALGSAEESGLATGAQGAPGAWTRALMALHGVLAAYNRAEGTLSANEGLRVEGRIAPGHDRAALAAWAESALPAGWPVALSGRAAPASEGARRTDPATRRTETLRGGRWIPDYEFPVGAARCTAEAARLRRGGGLGFAPGMAMLPAGAAEPLDALAGLARHCLAGTGLGLEIGGHTDDRGEPAANRALSLKRAGQVRTALVRRGVPADAIAARGYGADRPVADNATEAGRARNRRITFEFTPAAPAGADRETADR